MTLDEQDQERRALQENILALEKSLGYGERHIFELRRVHASTEILETAPHDDLAALYDELRARETKRDAGRARG